MDLDKVLEFLEKYKEYPLIAVIGILLLKPKIAQFLFTKMNVFFNTVVGFDKQIDLVKKEAVKLKDEQSVIKEDQTAIKKTQDKILKTQVQQQTEIELIKQSLLSVDKDLVGIRSEIKDTGDRLSKTVNDYISQNNEDRKSLDKKLNMILSAMIQSGKGNA